MLVRREQDFGAVVVFLGCERPFQENCRVGELFHATKRGKFGYNAPANS